MSSGLWPTRVDEVTTEWLEAALQEVSGGAGLRAFSVERIAEGVGLMTNLYRLELHWETAAAGAPGSVVMKLASDNPAAVGVVTTFDLYAREAGFYRDLAERTLSRTPACWAVEHDPSTQSVLLLLEDAGAGRCVDQVVGATEGQVFSVVEELAKLHASWWEHRALAELAWLPSIAGPVNTAGVPMALDACVPHAATFLRLPEWYAQYRETVTEVLARLAELPSTLVHGDMRLDNLFFDVGTDPLLVVDWQIVMRGPGIYDLAYFLSQSVTVERRRAVERRAVETYRRRLVELGVDPPSVEELWDGYRLASLFCVCYPLIAGGTVDPADERAVALCRQMTERCISVVEDLDAVALLAMAGVVSRSPA